MNIPYLFRLFVFKFINKIVTVFFDVEIVKVIYRKNLHMSKGRGKIYLAILKVKMKNA